MSRVARLLKDEFGAAMVEMAIVIPLLLTLTLGFVDFGYAFYQWNAANKAVQVGARLVSISNPIATGLVNAVATLPSGDAPGDAVAAGTYDYICTANSAGTASCQNCVGGKCTAATASQSAFDMIFGGDGGRPGMQTFLPTLQKSELRIEYAATGLDFWTRPGGPVPTITVSIVNHPFQFFFLGGLLGFANITMPDMHSTVTGEDLSSTY
jgi:Flp pilus assembly protein TadG